MHLTNLTDLCIFFGAATPANLNRRVYSETACGASISIQTPDGAWLTDEDDSRWNTITEIVAFSFHAIVEGSDAEFSSATIPLPTNDRAVRRVLQWLEQEAATAWKQANAE